MFDQMYELFDMFISIFFVKKSIFWLEVVETIEFPHLINSFKFKCCWKVFNAGIKNGYIFFRGAVILNNNNWKSFPYKITLWTFLL